MKIENLALRWLAEQQYAETTRTTYMDTVRQLARRFPLPAERVTTEHLIDFLTLDDDGATTARGPATVHRQRTTLRCFFRWAHRRGHVKRDPAAPLDELVLGRGRRRAGRWLTRAEARMLIDAVDVSSVQGHRDRVLLVVALLTGLRRAELSALRWRDVDLRQGRVSVMGKGSKPAVIGLPEQAGAELNDWRVRVASAQGRMPPAGSPVFPTGRTLGGIHGSRFYRVDWARPLGLGAVHRIVARHAEAAGLGAVGTHDLRRSFAGWLDEDGVDLKGIQAALRHSSPGVTATCYLDASPRRAVEAVRNLRILTPGTCSIPALKHQDGNGGGLGNRGRESSDIEEAS